MVLVRGLVRLGYREIRRKESFYRKFFVVSISWLDPILKFLKSTHTYAFIFSWPASLCKLEFALINLVQKQLVDLMNFVFLVFSIRVVPSELRKTERATNILPPLYKAAKPTVTRKESLYLYLIVVSQASVI